jgi:hypothetical protein
MPAPVTRPEPETVTDTDGDAGGGAAAAKVALTAIVLAVPVETVHVELVPLQAPLQPVKALPLFGVATRVTLVFAVSVAEHVEPLLPHVMPPPVTVPGPEAETFRVAPPVKLAVTLRDADIDTVHVVAVPPHAPVQPPKLAPVFGVATSVTDALAANDAEQTVAPLPQLIAPLPPVTPPGPLTVTLRVTAGTKVALTLVSADTVTVQLPLPLQAPPQPVNVYPDDGVAVSVTDALSASVAVQADGQLSPPPVIVPFPFTVADSVFVDPDASHAALTVVLPESVTVHDCAVPLHPPPQPANAVLVVAGVSKRVSVEPVRRLLHEHADSVAVSTPQ